jgi:predicted phosphodiesterase
MVDLGPQHPSAELTTVGHDIAVVHRGGEARRYDGLADDTDHTIDGVSFRTLAHPGGALLARIATVNDLHFGELECGRIDDHPDGPIQRVAEGETPYPDLMNRGAADEIDAAGVDAVIVKGDLTADGTDDEFAAFDACYGRFGDSLHVVRGNHDSYRGQDRHTGDRWIELEGVAIALLDTVIPRATTGRLSPDQLDWLDTLAAGADRPVLVMGHHQQWIEGARSDDYFGLHPDSSDALAAVIERRQAIVAYSAGHTHRHRVRRTAAGVASIEVGCVKDFPGTWAEYHVFEGGLLQVVHRISTPDALAWSERCRHLYRDFGIDYADYALGPLDHRCFAIPLR